MRYLSEHPITSSYGNRSGGFHHGVDFGTPTGTSIPAIASGTVVFEGSIPPAAPGYSDEIICIVQSEGHFVVYGHLSATLVDRGQQVAKGQVIARSGNTGFVIDTITGKTPRRMPNGTVHPDDVNLGAHLHLEQRRGTKDPAKPISAYTSTNITPLIEAYGAAQGGGQDMFVIAKPITPLDVKLAKPIKMFNIETGQEMHDSGLDMLLVAKTNIVHGSTFYIPVDRWDSGEPFGFREQDIYAKDNKVAEVPVKDWKGEYDAYRQRAEAEMKALDQQVIDMKITLESQAEEHNRVILKMSEDIRLLNQQLDKALQNVKDVERWTWQEHLQALIQKLIGGGEK